MKIEIWSDFVCPFCYIGKRKLEKALDKFPHKDKVKIEFRSYELNPDAPKVPDGMGYEAFAKLKNMKINEAKEFMDSVAKTAKNYDLDYHMDKIVLVSTKDAHRLAKWAKRFKKDKELTEALMHAYFTKGVNIADFNELTKIVEKLGLNKKDALEVLNSNRFEKEVLADIEEANTLGIRGVPFFVFDRNYAVSGAQPDQMFEQALEKSYEESYKFKDLNVSNTEVCDTDECN
ncbi:DsbA family oxidoreductase [Haploplasma axanthum]|uniref:Protein-disulfide isomerase n=1 Tax=Haploplasma axanthum TaxID=29552 RepID=A0A449BCV8_HAPAX|nr:DsbA family oxidoreductase [Haploplasma axanthum]VEU80284.1 Protein-disulfide isomerase [Haploplasma axanthum]